MRRRLINPLVLAVAAALALACTDATSPLDFAGVYTLKTVNGLPLPYVFAPTGPTIAEALDDAYTLNFSGTYSEAGHKTFTTGGVVTLVAPVDIGNFTRKGDNITLESLIYGATPGTIKGGTLTVVQQGLTLVYQK